MNEEPKTELTEQQIENWRRVISFTLVERVKKQGMDFMEDLVILYAHSIPKEKIIEFRNQMQMQINQKKKQKTIKLSKKQCDHSNSIKGANGRYCLDCDKYV